MLESLNPQKVFHYFEEISAIPHGSGNINAIGDYCMNFAKHHNLKAVKESCGNVIIYAEGTGGFENYKPVILQGHLDMVCEKRADCNKNMETEPIDLRTNGEWVWAEGTTLGGDDGIAIAYILALLDSPEIPHPPIEALLTSDEETGMTGAEELDGSLLKGRTLINIDSEEEGYLTVSCAGGVRAEVNLQVNYQQLPPGMMAARLSISGLSGGHSGVDIDKNRENAHKILGDALNSIYNKSPFLISELTGGEKTNVIPKEASTVIVYPENKHDIIKSDVEETISNLKNKYKCHLDIDFTPENTPSSTLIPDSTTTVISALVRTPDGVCSKFADGLVKGSLNIGVLSLDYKKLNMGYLIRGNAKDEIERIKAKLTNTFENVTFDSYYPSWEYRESSPLRDLMSDVFEKMYGRKPTITAIHAGLECGLLGQKLPGVDMVSIGPDIENVHTPDEQMSVASVQHTWDYLLAVLKALGEQEK